MHHTLKIGIGKPPQDGGIVRCKKLNIRERILQLLLGKQQRLTILVPGDSVQSLSIFESEEEKI
jgi:hypothetical protein